MALLSAAGRQIVAAGAVKWLSAAAVPCSTSARTIAGSTGVIQNSCSRSLQHGPRVVQGGTIPPQLQRLFASLPPHTELQMPALSPTMSHGNIAEWHVKEGQEIGAGDVLADIETDKATLAWENQDDGFVAKLLLPAGTKDVEVGTPVLVVVEDESSVSAFGDYSPGGSKQSSAASESQQSPESEGSPDSEASHPEPSAPPVERNTRIGPAAQKLLAQSGLSPGDITPTGPHGIITKGDVMAAISSGKKPGEKPQQQQQSPPPPETSKASQPKPEAKPETKPADEKRADTKPAPAPPQKARKGSRSETPYTDIPNSQIRKIIAQRLLESKQTIPHLYLTAHADLDGVQQLRETLKGQGIKVSVNDFVIRAAALALAEVPQANARWDTAKEEIVANPSVDVSIAVATPAGLITPIVAAANTKSLPQISAEVKDLAGRARANKLKPHEFQGGSFSISNLGMYGVDSFSAIINPPQACIMAVGGSHSTVHMGEDGEPVAKSQMTVTLSADHRVYDGETAGAFLKAFTDKFNNPVQLIL